MQSPTRLRSQPGVYAGINSLFAPASIRRATIGLLEKRLEEKYPVEQILESLRRYNTVQFDKNIYSFTYYDRILADCSEKFNLDLSLKKRKRDSIRRLLKY